MTVDRIQLLRNVGQFDSVNLGAQIALSPLTLIYAENGRGKTTLATILRSMGTDDPSLIEDRRRLGSAHGPHVVLTISGAQLIYQNAGWGQPLPRVAVFDDAFVAANVCSGIDIETSHRQNLHELILGAQGVALNTALQQHVGAIEQHNRELRLKEAAVPAAQRGGLSVDAFCALAGDADIDIKIEAAHRSLTAAQAADAIRQRQDFQPLALPTFDIAAIREVLGRTLPDLQAEAGARVREHLRSLGRGGEVWVSEGMARLRKRPPEDEPACPFCAQDLAGSPLIAHYEAFFSEAYQRLKADITETGTGVRDAHAGEVQAAFERDVRVTGQSREFWREFLDVPEFDPDTAAILRSWISARDAVLVALRAKAAAPLENMELPAEAIAAFGVYQREVEAVAALSVALAARNHQIALVKEQAAAANVAALTEDVAQLRRVKARHSQPLQAACDDYVAEKAAKIATEQARDAARAALNQYRDVVFPAYEQSINNYLARFNAGYRLGAVGSVNTRAGSSASYAVVVNNVPVGLNANSGPSFKTVLSAGDRNTLALAFFFAALERDANLATTIVVIDDPMTSLDEHRTLTTVEEVLRLVQRVGQVVVLSHSKSFLCQIWEDADPQSRSALRINRDGAGSTIDPWDVRHDRITEHDRRHALVQAYLQAANVGTERAVAQAIRPILEAYMRVAYPSEFPPGALLGPFINACRHRVGQANELMSAPDLDELESLKNYGNRFHHDTNPAWQTAAINDQELTNFVRRTLAFTRR